MNRIWRRLATLTTALPFFVGAAATNGPVEAAPALTSADAAWNETVRSNTLEAYAQFAMDYPDSKFAAQAYAALSGIGAVGNGAGTEGDDPSALSKPMFVPDSLMVV